MNVAYGVRSDKRDESCKMVACVKDASVNKPKTHHPCPASGVADAKDSKDWQGSWHSTEPLQQLVGDEHSIMDTLYIRPRDSANSVTPQSRII